MYDAKIIHVPQLQTEYGFRRKYGVGYFILFEQLHEKDLVTREQIRKCTGLIK